MKVIEGGIVRYRSAEALARRAERRRQRQRDGRCNHTKRKWSERNPEKRAAHYAVNNAVRDGKLDKPKSCPKCGRVTRIFGHHDDYSKPLEVVWLCGKCHHQLHKNESK